MKFIVALSLAAVLLEAIFAPAEAAMVPPPKATIENMAGIEQASWRRCWRDRWGRLRCQTCWRNRWGRIRCR